MAANAALVDPKALLTGEQGSVAGDRLYSTYDEFAALMGPTSLTQGLDAATIENMLRRDGKVRSVEQVLTLPLRSVPWSVEGDDEAAVLVRETLGGLDPPPGQVIAEMAGASIFAYSTHELVWAERNGRLVIERIAYRPQASTKPKVNDRTGALEGFTQRVHRDGADPLKKVSIPAARALVVIHNRHRRPLSGVSDLECAHTLFEHRQKARYLYFSYLEGQSMPKAIVTHSNNDPTQQQQLGRKVATLRGQGVLVIGPEQKVEPYEGSGRGAQEFREAIDQLGREMADSVLAGFLNLSAGDGGSYALADSLSDFFAASRQAVLSELAGAIQAQVVRPLVQYNFGVDAKVPLFSFAPLVREHTDAAFALLQAMAADLPEEQRASLVTRLSERVAGLLDLPTEGTG